MSPQARTGLIAVGIVGGLFLLAGGVIGVAALARPDKGTAAAAAHPSGPADPSAPRADPPEDPKAAHAKELARLRDRLLLDIDAAIRAEHARGAGIDYLLKERKGWAENGVLPMLPKLLPARQAYLDGKKAADDVLAIRTHRWWRKSPTGARLEEVVRFVIGQNRGGAVLIDDAGQAGKSAEYIRGAGWADPVPPVGDRFVAVGCDWPARPSAGQVLSRLRAAIDGAEYAGDR